MSFRHIALLLILGVFASQASTDDRCCSMLGVQYPTHVFLPGTARYVEESQTAFWSNTSRLQPACVFTPASAEIVSDALNLFKQHDCKFAVRGGGHMANRAASSIEGEILLALTDLSEMSLQDGFVSVGAGQRWGNVFDFLLPEGLAVVGGRVAVVGVSGLTLGGGLSTFSGKRGFACDNVKNFQVVLAGGRIVDANQSSHPDLFWALKGGSSNFGIVTRFDLYTHNDSMIYTGVQSINMSGWDEVAVAINNFMTLRADHETADDMGIAPKLQWVSGRSPEILISLSSTLLPAPNDGWSNATGSAFVLPPALQDFANLPLNQASSTKMSIMSFAEKTKTPVPYGLRYELRVVSFRSSVKILNGMKSAFEEEFAEAFSKVIGFSGVIEIQPITKRNIREGHIRGGNALGLTEDRGPMIWAVMANSWLNETDDALVQAAGQRVVDRLHDLSQKLGLYDPFLFLNDAGVGQEPISTYGQESLSRLREVKQMYDAQGTFDLLLPGGFKLPKP